MSATASNLTKFKIQIAQKTRANIMLNKKYKIHLYNLFQLSSYSFAIFRNLTRFIALIVRSIFAIITRWSHWRQTSWEFTVNLLNIYLKSYSASKCICPHNTYLNFTNPPLDDILQRIFSFSKWQVRLFY